jgi:endonuclease/exonuclease/phosphatase family metal-dependent hydrolase
MRPTLRNTTPALACALGFGTLQASAQSTAILMDGRFDDWPPALTTFTDSDAPSTGIDLLNMQVTNDEAYLFIKLTVGSEVDLQDDLVPQTIRLYIDGDNNSATGLAAQTGYGAEVQVKFDTRTVTEYFGASSNVSWSNLDLVPLPTTTGSVFEIAIARNAKPDGVNDLFSSGTVKLLFRETDGGDAMPNSGTVFIYTFDGTPTVQSAPIDVGRADASLVRITAWNVLADGITNAALQGQYQRMLSALSPDVIGFSECVTSSAAQVKTKLDTWIPIGGGGWNTVKDDYDMVIASRWPITQTWPSLTRQFAALIDLPSTYATDLLFTAAHLHCCTADAARQNQADEYVRFVQDAKNAGGAFTLPANTPMVYAGDLNSVGYVQQMTTLLTGDIVNNATYGADGPMDWDGSAATSAELEQTDARMAYTWRSNTSAYPSGRLDHLFYTDAAMNLAKSFTLRTEVMPVPTLTALGLNATDASTASDHFPITADFSVPQANVRVNVRCLLEGPFDANTGLMHDSLRVQGLVPLTEPYTALGFTQVSGGGESMAPAVLNATGNNAIVDHVLLELRDKNDPTVILSTRCALVQRDGDVVDVDGLVPVTFARTGDQYYVAVRHRNHLGTMTANAIALSNAPVTIDFTAPTTSTYGTNATKALNSVQVLWCGNTVRDGVLKYTGTANDRDAILVVVGGNTPNNTTSGYAVTDVNMDGTIKYTGAGNDRDPVLVNVGSTTPNGTKTEQIP